MQAREHAQTLKLSFGVLVDERKRYSAIVHPLMCFHERDFSFGWEPSANFLLFHHIWNNDANVILKIE